MDLNKREFSFYAAPETTETDRFASYIAASKVHAAQFRLAVWYAGTFRPEMEIGEEWFAALIDDAARHSASVREGGALWD